MFGYVGFNGFDVGVVMVEVLDRIRYKEEDGLASSGAKGGRRGDFSVVVRRVECG